MDNTKVLLSNLLSDLHAQDKETYYQVQCPECGEHEAYIYKNSLVDIEQGKSHKVRIHCSRLNNCGKTTVIENVWWDEASIESCSFDETVESSKYPTVAISERTTSLMNLNYLIKGYGKLEGWRGISKQTLLDNGVIYLAQKPFPKGWLTFLKQRSSEVPDKLLEKEKLYSCRDVVIPFKNEDGYVDRVLLRSAWKKDAFPKEVTFKMCPHSVPIWNIKDIKGTGDVLFITEGVPDALSVKEVAKDALVVALPGVGQWRHFARYIQEMSNFKKEVVVCFDADRAGKKCSRALKASLLNSNVHARDFNLSSYKDMNEFLLGNRALFQQRVNGFLHC